jgi:hypothetical protein
LRQRRRHARLQAEFRLTVDALRPHVERLGGEAVGGGPQVQPLPQPAGIECRGLVVEIAHHDHAEQRRRRHMNRRVASSHCRSACSADGAGMIFAAAGSLLLSE